MDLKQFLPLPDLDALPSLLCVQPHPDDNEVGAGATIARVAKKGCRVTYVTVTDGGMGSTDMRMSREALASIRRGEAQESGGMLGVSGFVWLDYPDGGGWSGRDLRDQLVRLIRELRPAALMAPDPWLLYEGHPDHVRTGLAAVEACLFSALPRCGGGAGDACGAEHSGGNCGGIGECSGTDASRFVLAAPCQPEWVILHSTSRPNVWVNADDTWELKMKAVAAHASQFAYEWEMVSSFLAARAQSLAEGRGFQTAEAFKVLPPIMLHAMPEAEAY
ncbi:MAG: PIG-L family deacetylase [Clostridia bacterium]|nr:PIG-L family deacetylase [Clostridia bacterium]